MTLQTPHSTNSTAVGVDLDGKVLLFAGDNDTADQFSVFADGIVFHGAAGMRAAVRCDANTLRLIDRELYKDDRRKSHHPQLMPETAEEAIHAQLSAGAGVLLSPARFPRDRSERSIQMLLAAGAEFVAAAARQAPGLAAYVPLVIRFDELEDRRWTEPIQRAELPVAPIFAGFGDPLGNVAAVEGAIELCRAAPAAFPIRGDLSVAGLIAHGASGGAIGVSSAVRHLWLPRSGGSSTPAATVFVPQLRNWMKQRFAAQAAADPDLDVLFACDCAVCGPNGDLRDLLAENGPAHLVERHSVAASIEVVRKVMGSTDRLHRWRTACIDARDGYRELGRLGVSGPVPPASLRAWLESVGE